MPAFKYIGGEDAPEFGNVFGFDVEVGKVIVVPNEHECLRLISGHRWFEPTKAEAASEAEPDDVTTSPVEGNAFDTNDVPIAYQDAPRRRGRPPKVRSEDEGQKE